MGNKKNGDKARLDNETVGKQETPVIEASMPTLACRLTGKGKTREEQRVRVVAKKRHKLMALGLICILYTRRAGFVIRAEQKESKKGRRVKQPPLYVLDKVVDHGLEVVAVPCVQGLLQREAGYLRVHFGAIKGNRRGFSFCRQIRADRTFKVAPDGGLEFSLAVSNCSWLNDQRSGIFYSYFRFKRLCLARIQ